MSTPRCLLRRPTSWWRVAQDNPSWTQPMNRVSRCRTRVVAASVACALPSWCKARFGRWMLCPSPMPGVMLDRFCCAVVHRPATRSPCGLRHGSDSSPPVACRRCSAGSESPARPQAPQGRQTQRREDGCRNAVHPPHGNAVRKSVANKDSRHIGNQHAQRGAHPPTPAWHSARPWPRWRSGSCHPSPPGRR